MSNGGIMYTEASHKKLKVLLIDICDTIDYSIEYANCCRKYSNGTVVRKYYTSDKDALPIFYKFSEKMRPGYVRYLIRYIEYILSYIYVYRMICKNHYDVVHIQWPQVLWFDKIIFKKICHYYLSLILSS